MHRITLIGSFIIALTLYSCKPNEEQKEVRHEHKQSTSKYAADVPDFMITPNSVQTKYAGELEFIDGFPTDKTLVKTNYFMDVARAFELFESGMATASMYAMLNGHAQIGVKANKTIAITEQLV
jgi:formiminotetrahydrofolate cyclodeaminase